MSFSIRALVAAAFRSVVGQLLDSRGRRIIHGWNKPHHMYPIITNWINMG